MYKAQWSSKNGDSNGVVSIYTMKALVLSLAQVVSSKKKLKQLLADLNEEGQVNYKRGRTFFECWKVVEYQEPDDLKGLTLAEVIELAGGD